MIVDWKHEPDHAHAHDILDAETGEPLPMDLPIFYADDQLGILRLYKRDGRGQYYFVDPNEPGKPVAPWRRFKRHGGDYRDVTPKYELAWEEVRRPIRIVRKPS